MANFPPIALVRSEQLFIRRCVDVLVTLAVLYGFDRNGFQLKKTYDHWIYCASVCGDAVKFVKYKIAAYYVSNKQYWQTRHMELYGLSSTEFPYELELPADITAGFDKPNCLMGGRFYRWSRLLSRTQFGLFDSFLSSVLQSKKGMPRPDKSRLLLAEVDAFKTLTRKPVRPLVEWGQFSDKFKTDQDLSENSFGNQLRRTVRELFAGKKYTDADRMSPFFPSTSANYINNRNNGGALGLLFDDTNRRVVPDSGALDDAMLQAHPLGVNDPLNVIGQFQDNPDLVTDNYDILRSLDDLRSSVPLILTENLKIRSRVSPEIKELRNIFKDIPDDVLSHINTFLPNEFVRSNFPIVDITSLQETFSTMMERITKLAILEEPIAVPLALAEPLKTRVITKGPGLTYTVLKPLQRFLWSVLKDHKVFRLIGSPVTAEIIQEQLGAKLRDDMGFLSVDYKDATNQLHSWASDFVVDEICNVLSLHSDERELFFRAMTRHRIKEPSVTPPNILNQENGQLMGSVVSFPILCIINAALLRWTCELDQKRTYTLNDCSITVNGDDAVIKCTSRGYSIWKELCTFCGLSPSIGKVYFSRCFLNMNSTTFNYFPLGCGSYTTRRREVNGSYTDVVRNLHYQSVPYVNLGLLFGLKRSGRGEKAGLSSDLPSDNISSRAHQLINECPSSIIERVLCQYIHVNKTYLSRYSIPWFIPRTFGGMGLPCFGKYRPSNHDLRFARLIYEHPKDLKVPSLPPNTPWKVWEFVQKKYPEEVHQHSHGNCSYDQLWGYACVELLFTERFKHYFKGDVVTENTLRFYKQCERLWKSAHLLVQKGKFLVPEPFDPENYPTIYSRSHIKQLNIINRFDLLTLEGQHTPFQTSTTRKSWHWPVKLLQGAVRK